ncbi:MAG: DNA-protecting protein DprA [Sulfurospirillaceae bacterium]|nr:DNA-protecting protein DprA [Sulfurospirillaceae bacterium]MDD2827442.1 DNA-protecting protein DprA [Sulfurospirillaceae bacterium]
MKLIDIAILTNIKGLGSVNLIKILNYCKLNNINSIYELKDFDLTKIVNTKLANTIEIYLDTNIDNLYSNIQNLINSYQKDDIHCVTINDKHYPDILKESTNPPAILYCKGNLDLLNSNCIAVIGTRENTSTGAIIATKTVEFLIQNNFTIVSGLAKGMDSIAHATTLKNEGKTIAIIPLIDNIYPTENKKLAQDILDNNGLLISEEKPGTKFYSAQLVKRDRIQSGLSKSVFVIETSLKGGSMHAVNDAIKLKRAVFTPDIYKLDEKYQTFKQVEGVKHLIDSHTSIPYTSNNYDEIIAKLNISLQKDTLW